MQQTKLFNTPTNYMYVKKQKATSKEFIQSENQEISYFTHLFMFYVTLKIIYFKLHMAGRGTIIFSILTVFKVFSSGQFSCSVVYNFL